MLSVWAVGIIACSLAERNVHRPNSGKFASTIPASASPLSTSRMANRSFSVVGPFLVVDLVVVVIRLVGLFACKVTSFWAKTPQFLRFFFIDCEIC